MFWKFSMKTLEIQFKCPEVKVKMGGRVVGQSIAPSPRFVKSVTLFQPRGRLCPPNYYQPPPGFVDPPTALHWRKSEDWNAQAWRKFCSTFDSTPTTYFLGQCPYIYQNKGTTLWSSGHEIMHLCSQNLQKMWNTFGSLPNFDSFFKACYLKDERL